MKLFNIPQEVRCPECGITMMTGPAPSRLIVPNRIWVKCLNMNCGNHARRFIADLPVLEAREVTDTDGFVDPD